MKSTRSLLVLACLFAALSFRASGGDAPRVDVILWFDTEDYLLPASDDAAKRLAELLTARNVPATFKVVGEKARTLERRGRKDVISALRKHTIAYHSDFHSVHPTPTEYLAECGLLDGIAEFVRREGDGAADVRRIFGVKTLACYGQPGSSWAPQAVAGLKQIGVAPDGVACYVDEGTHVGLEEQPFWYAGALNVYHMGQNYTRMELHDPAASGPAREKVSAIAERLARKGGGLISIFYHPCEWVHQQFWDGVNFSRGANPPREEWKAPPRRTAEETEGAFQRFGEYIDHIRRIPGARFVTAADLPSMYLDRTRKRAATAGELERMAEKIKSSKSLSFINLDDRSFSPSDQFELLVAAVAPLARGEKAKVDLVTSGLLGPDAVAPTNSNLTQASWLSFREAVKDVAEFVQTERRVPSRVFIGSDALAPADFLVAMAGVYAQHRRGGGFPQSVILPKGTDVATERYIAKDTPGLFGGWIIHKEGFRAPKLMELARLQAWSLKPALRSTD